MGVEPIERIEHGGTERSTSDRGRDPGWGLLLVSGGRYDELEGVEDVVSGYAGGRLPNPSYEQVCSGHDRPRRGRAGRVRPPGGLVREAAAKCSSPSTTRHNSTARAPTWAPVPLGDLLSRPRAEGRCRAEDRPDGSQQGVGLAGRNCRFSRSRVLPGGGLPSGVLQEEPQPALLPRRGRARLAKARKPFMTACASDRAAANGTAPDAG